MRKRFSEIIGSKFYTVDNAGLQSIGKVTDLLIEDGTWNVRYLVVSTVVSLSSHVLISPAAIQKFDFNIKSIVTALTSQRVVDSPPLAADQPISRRQEQALVDYYGWPIYWLGQVVSKSKISKSAAAENASNAADEKRHSNLRSAKQFCGYRVQSQNGSAGTMRDLVIDMESWTVVYATADTRSWLPKESPMFSTSWINDVDWLARSVLVDLSKAAINHESFCQDFPTITGQPHSTHRFRTV